MGDLYLGTSGYSFRDWVGEVYPSDIKSADMFSYYLHHFRFDSVEINFTYYKMPSQNVFRRYSAAVPEGFRYSVKLFSEITHAPWMRGGSGELDLQLCEQFAEGVSPIVQSGQLACLLAQFPPQFKPSAEAWDYLRRMSEALPGLSLVVEFRNRAWLSDFTYSSLRDMSVGLCAVDEPQIGPLMPLLPEVTSDIAYLRLHGRSDKWFLDSALRYDYLYSEDELRSFLPTISQMQDASKSLFVMFNNCHAGSAVRNVKMMQYLLGQDVSPLQRVLF